MNKLPKIEPDWRATGSPREGEEVVENLIKPPAGRTVTYAADPLIVAAEEADEAIRARVSELAKLTKERDLRRADSMWIVWRAKAQSGRGAEPPTDHDAAVCWNIAALLHTVARRTETVEEAPAKSETSAEAAKTSTKTIDLRVEAGIGATE